MESPDCAYALVTFYGEFKTRDTFPSPEAAMAGPWPENAVHQSLTEETVAGREWARISPQGTWKQLS